MFSKATEYALRATIFIADKGTIDNKISIEEISKAIDSPRPFTAKILQLLSKGNVISSAKGPKGGFYITHQSMKLPAKVILEAIEKEDTLNRCILGLHNCSETNPCPMHSEFKTIRAQLNNLFQKKTIQNLADTMKKSNVFINNSKNKSLVK
ncbi:MAG: Rrf2 family transcriptional regulator [Ginsengibacter sp.]